MKKIPDNFCKVGDLRLVTSVLSSTRDWNAHNIHHRDGNSCGSSDDILRDGNSFGSSDDILRDGNSCGSNDDILRDGNSCDGSSYGGIQRCQDRSSPEGSTSAFGDGNNGDKSSSCDGNTLGDNNRYNDGQSDTFD
ncbi:MAG: hypothetical protein PUP92_18960 [Rhizonema sp. PD38]|nr:hypothetical protein [Rhizonema sp. PD38]